MKYAIVFCLALIGCNCPTTPPVTRPCACDCPAGPPAPPAIDTYCTTAVDGAACCLGDKVGKCVNKECKP
jgi:hypothetical protein